MSDRDRPYRYTMPWNYDHDLYHHCFASGVHRRAEACRCPCASCAEWAYENKHRAAAERVPFDLARFTVVR